MAFIPEDKLLEIKDAASIEEVVGQYVKLTQKGRNLSGLCPFHSETKPSFTVAPEKGIFHCFGCGVGGNVFSFLMHYHRLSFPEAVQELARRYGIPVSLKDLGPEGAQQAKKRTKAYEANTAAAAFYAATLASSEGRPGREYLKKRGLTPEIIRAFQLGYAVDEWDALRRHFQHRGISLELGQEVGLLAPRDRGGFYDRFRGRIIFPIFDRQSRVIAFGGRIIGEGEPKYLNSPESLLYSKGRTLYGLPQAAEALRATGVALVVEGYLDLIALQVHGVANVLATLGTALTREQVRLLKAVADKVVLVYDGDAAGAKAMKRAFPLFAQENLAVRALPLPAGLDPDSYAQAHGVEMFRSAWDTAQPWFSYLLEDLITTHGLDIEGRVRILEELRPFVQVISDPVEQDLWLRQTSDRLGVDAAALRRSLTSLAPISAARLDPTRNIVVDQEKKLLRWVLAHPDAVSPEELEEWTEEFRNPDLKGLLELIITSYREHGSMDHSLLVQQAAGETQRQHICALTLEEDESEGPAGDFRAGDWRRDLKVKHLKKARARLKARLKNASDDEEVPLQVQWREIDQQLKDLSAL
ncbi:MAG TPA: DNA primase, partial [Desulfobaccales bacterium]|nr:DNA primase [Desulfobaccales bacterium]